MRSYHLCLASAILVVLMIGVPPHARCAKPPHDEFGTIEGAGVKVMAQAGIRRASDIESVLVNSGFTLKITRKDDPKLVTEIYEGLKSTVRVSVMRGIAAGSLLRLNMTNGKSIGFEYEILYSDSYHGGFKHPINVIVKRNYYSQRLLSPLQRIESSQTAALRDARVGGFLVASVEARVPGGQRVMLKPRQTEARALTAKGMAIIDWLDARTMSFESVKAEDIEAAGDKRGLVVISSVTPLRLKWPDPRAHPSPKTSDAFEVIPHRVAFKCDRIAILDYREWIKPQIVFRNAATGRYYFVGYYLRRRLQEQVGVEKYGWKGHPLTDTEYYKKPDVLYAEMEVIAKQAVEKYGKKTEQADPPR